MHLMFCKLNYNNVNKKFEIPYSMDELNKLVTQSFPTLNQKAFSLIFVDEDNDECLLENDFDLEQFIKINSNLEKNKYKLQVKEVKQVESEEKSSRKGSEKSEGDFFKPAREALENMVNKEELKDFEKIIADNLQRFFTAFDPKQKCEVDLEVRLELPEETEKKKEESKVEKKESNFLFKEELAKMIKLYRLTDKNEIKRAKMLLIAFEGNLVKASDEFMY